MRIRKVRTNVLPQHGVVRKIRFNRSRKPQTPFLPLLSFPSIFSVSSPSHFRCTAVSITRMLDSLRLTLEGYVCVPGLKDATRMMARWVRGMGINSLVG